MTETRRRRSETRVMDLWVILAITLTLGVCASLFWQHGEQRRALQATAETLEGIRQVRLDLAKGFLHLSLADERGSPFSRESGVALLRQAVASFEQALAHVASLDAESVEGFRRSALEFERLLDRSAEGREAGSAALVRLRIAYGHLERQAERLDQGLGHGLERLTARAERNFLLTLTGSAAALLFTIAILVLAAWRQRRMLTQREQANQALMESEAKRLEQAAEYQAVIETAMDGFVMLDTQGRIQAVNDAYIRRSGYHRDELVGMRVEDLDANGMALDLATWLERVGQGGGALFETWHRGKDGTLWPVEVSASLGASGGGHIHAFIRDISERKRAEQSARARQAEALEEQRLARLAALNLMEDAVAAHQRAESAIALLRESEQRLLLAQEGAHVGIWEWDPASDCVYWSPECYRLHGVAAGTVHGSEDWRACLLPEDRRRLGEAWEFCRATDQGFELEWRVHLDSGEVRWLVSRGGCQRDPSGRATRLSGVVMDITERKRMLDELAHYRLHLEELVAVRTAELAEARAEAERLARAKSEFLANMSHEIRTPLNAVLGLARIGQRESAGHPVQDRLARILAAGEHLLGVINDILDYSKIEAGRLGLESRPFRLRDSIATLVDLHVQAARDKGLSFRVQVSPGLPDWVQGDVQRLRQILVNLLSNAVKFTERGEVLLQVDAVGALTRFRVTDTGIGMTPETIRRLFRPFEQADGSTTRRFGGTGLGLAISQNLARLMGGGIQAESAPGQGSRFTLSLPLETAQPLLDEPRDETQPAGARLTGWRVLAAEDVEVNRLILEDLLEQEGARVVLVENGRLALERLRAEGEGAFDLVLMDVQMPEMDGYEATRRIREWAPDLPVIGLTAHALPEERAKCRAAGMVDHVTKPIDPDTLVAAMRRHASRSPAAAARSAPPPEPGSAEVSRGRPDPGADTGLIDWKALRVRFAGREGFVDKLARVALEANAPLSGRLTAAIQAHDLNQLHFIAHSVKGSAGNLAAQAVTELARETELAAKSGDERAFALGGRLVLMLEDLTAELSAYRSSAADPKKGA